MVTGTAFVHIYHLCRSAKQFDAKLSGPQHNFLTQTADWWSNTEHSDVCMGVQGFAVGAKKWLLAIC